MQKRNVKVPRIYKAKFLDTLGDQYMKSVTDDMKIAYANRAMKYEYILSAEMYEHDSMRANLEKYAPHLVSEWDDVVNKYGV